MDDIDASKCCPVCFENKTYEITKCGHHICKECFAKMITISNRCPLCRSELVFRAEEASMVVSHGSIDELTEHLFYPGGRIYNRQPRRIYRLW